MLRVVTVEAADLVSGLEIATVSQVVLDWVWAGAVGFGRHY